MYISYDYYRVFYYVVKYGNVSQAAKLLLNNQPNLTRTIRNLESELGCPLFSRTNRGMKLTPEGERLYAHVRIAFEHIEAGEAELTEARNLQTGTVYIAASEVALRCLLLPVLKQYRLLYPGVHIRISNHSTPQAIAALKDGAADIAVVTTPTVRSASLVETAIRPIQEVAVCSSAFPGLTGQARGALGAAGLSHHFAGAGYQVLCVLFRFLYRSRPALSPCHRGIYRRPDIADGGGRPGHRVRTE